MNTTEKTQLEIIKTLDALVDAVKEIMKVTVEQKVRIDQLEQQMKNLILFIDIKGGSHGRTA